MAWMRRAEVSVVQLHETRRCQMLTGSCIASMNCTTTKRYQYPVIFEVCNDSRCSSCVLAVYLSSDACKKRPVRPEIRDEKRQRWAYHAKSCVDVCLPKPSTQTRLKGDACSKDLCKPSPRLQHRRFLLFKNAARFAYGVYCVATLFSTILT